MSALDSAWLAEHPLPQPEGDTDKNSRGRVLIAGGSETVPGALRLTGEAAFRAGAGKVQLATAQRVALALGLTMPEAAVYSLPTNEAGELGAEAGPKLAEYLTRCDTLVLGPGMGSKSAAAPILSAAIAKPRSDLSLVIDAAALTAAPDMADALQAHEGRIVLTPHPGEMIQLMQCDEARTKDDPAGLVREAAERFGATVLLKGALTWIACPDQPVLRYAGGGPGLATGGSGDVLAGIIGALMARGATPRVAAAWGVWLHGEAGRRLAETVGPLGFLGRELPPLIPGLLNSTR
ncbi:NAD(P)H-hydrate dehydratase [Sphingomonas sp. IC-56]|uniref:NAD(P)H-hydrate dehydratase n=1 Tax=Sphingomonas sp. IC-56 TaxID=2898529 RepID=UPI001E4CAE43|nr:NAD(P)H-hydrate dehydratase [Sphingomonas sp. IC-56]MCD2324589.1 NAD(P)H-hydrate dehydratase [Sphingomonas sp. IC-56]